MRFLKGAFVITLVILTFPLMILRYAWIVNTRLLNEFDTWMSKD